MIKFLKSLPKEPYVTIVLMLSGINYYFLSLFVAITYDISHKLSGGPATMVVGFGLGPIIAIVFWIITNITLKWFLKKNKYVVSGIIIVLHLLGLLLLLFFFAIAIFYYLRDGITSPFRTK